VIIDENTEIKKKYIMILDIILTETDFSIFMQRLNDKELRPGKEDLMHLCL